MLNVTLDGHLPVHHVDGSITAGATEPLCDLSYAA